MQYLNACYSIVMKTENYEFWNQTLVTLVIHRLKSVTVSDKAKKALIYSFGLLQNSVERKLRTGI